MPDQAARDVLIAHFGFSETHRIEWEPEIDAIFAALESAGYRVEREQEPDQTAGDVVALTEENRCVAILMDSGMDYSQAVNGFAALVAFVEAVDAYAEPEWWRDGRRSMPDAMKAARVAVEPVLARLKGGNNG